MLDVASVTSTVCDLFGIPRPADCVAPPFSEVAAFAARRTVTKALVFAADAIGAHYKPLGPSDDVPREPTALAAALADKLDTLVGFWAIDEKPTGSKDPYALRRAALGVIRMVL